MVVAARSTEEGYGGGGWVRTMDETSVGRKAPWVTIIRYVIRRLRNHGVGGLWGLCKKAIVHRINTA